VLYSVHRPRSLRAQSTHDSPPFPPLTATTGVSYVAPAYIADRLCEQGRAYLRPWAEGPDLAPVWEMPKDPKTGRPVSKEAFQEWRKETALVLARTTTVWGKNYNDDETLPEVQRRLNPWHPNLDKGMFWM
jgi:eukaryotic translation initiation factor 2C